MNAKSIHELKAILKVCITNYRSLMQIFNLFAAEKQRLYIYDVSN